MSYSFENKTPEEVELQLAVIETDVTSAATTADAAQPKTGNVFTVATLPDASANTGRVVYVSDGSAGSATGAISDGTNWKVIGTLGNTCAAE